MENDNEVKYVMRWHDNSVIARAQDRAIEEFLAEAAADPSKPRVVVIDSRTGLPEKAESVNDKAKV